MIQSYIARVGRLLAFPVIEKSISTEPMARFLAFLMIFTLVIGNGTSVAAAICHHQSLAEHVAARQGSDHGAASVSLREEAAADFVAKKGSQSSGASVHWPAEMLPASLDSEPFRTIEPLIYPSRAQAALKSASPRPLLEPPSA